MAKPRYSSIKHFVVHLGQIEKLAKYDLLISLGSPSQLHLATLVRHRSHKLKDPNLFQGDQPNLSQGCHGLDLIRLEKLGG